MSVQPDGKVVVAGTLIDFDHPRAGRLLVARFLPDGRPDPAFGSGGTARLRLSLPASANAIAVQPDGRIVLAGDVLRSQPPADGSWISDGAVVRLFPNGSLDESFGAGGLATVTVTNPEEVAPTFGGGFERVGLQPDGRIVAAGYSGSYDRTHQGEWLGVARLTPDGRLDPTFDEDGFGFNPNDFPTAVAMHPNGSVVIAGWNSACCPRSLFALRFSTGPASVRGDALPDAGIAGFPFEGGPTAAGMVVREDGSLVLAGELGDRVNVERKFVGLVLRPDLREKARYIGPTYGVQAVALDAHDALITAGNGSSRPQDSSVGLARYRGGKLTRDRSFGDAGRSLVDLNTPVEVIGTAVHRSRILIAAREEGPPRETQSLVLARLHGDHDRAGPIVSMRGIRSRGCIQGLLRLRIRVRDQSKVHVHVRLDRRVRMRSRRARFQTKL